MAVYEYPYTDFNEYNLDWCIKRIRDLTDEWAATHTEWEDTKTEWEGYKNYIDNYFNTLDVQANIDAKINKMIMDGTFESIIRPFFNDAIADVPNVVTSWLDDHIDPDSGYVIDDTLTIEDAAADAKAVGDRIATGYDDMKHITGNGCVNNADMVKGFAYRTGSGDTIIPGTPIANSAKQCIYFPCTEGEQFTITNSYAGTNNYADYAFIDSAGAILQKGYGLYTNKIITAPQDTEYVVFNAVKENLNRLTWIYTGKVVTEILKDIGYEKRIPIITAYQAGYYWNDENATAELTEYSGYYAFAPIPVEPGMHIYAEVFTAHSSRQDSIVLVDDTYTIIERKTATRDQMNTFDFLVPAGVTKLLITTAPFTQAMNTCCYQLIITNEADTAYENTFKGCKLSLLGDSFSAMESYSTDGHDYYPNVNSNVQLKSQMWWQQVCDAFEMDPLVIGAWSGSCVTSGVRDDASYMPASDPYRCEALDDNGDDPDVIMVAMGVNDYSYSSSASQFTEWNGKTRLGNAADLSDYINTDFERAYATMLARMQKKYPNALIIAITPFFQCRYSTDTGANYLNAIGKSIQEYADSVRKVCGIMHVPVINGTDIGFNRYNYYPTYAMDSAVHPTHPTILGQKTIADAIIAAMRAMRRF